MSQSEIATILTGAPDFINVSSLYINTLDYVYKSRYSNFKIHIVTDPSEVVYCFRLIKSKYQDYDVITASDTIFYSINLDTVWSFFTPEQQKYFAFHLDIVNIKR